MTSIVVTLEELEIIPTITIEDGSPLWFDHSKVVEAFKINGLGPLVRVKDLYEAIFNTEFVGFVPDESFFTDESPQCPFFEIDEYFKSKLLNSYYSWQPNCQWLLEKK